MRDKIHITVFIEKTRISIQHQKESSECLIMEISFQYLMKKFRIDRWGKQKLSDN
jgi:hypothetical protein